MAGDKAAMGEDPALAEAIRIARGPAPRVMTVFDEPTFTASHIVADPASGACAVIDPVLGFDPSSGRTDTRSADRLIALVRDEGLSVAWILETHAHADHLSAAPYIRENLGGRIAIGAKIGLVRDVFAPLFGAHAGLSETPLPFDRLFEDAETFAIGELTALALHTPGHTPADLTYVLGGCAFIGDTLFMPDSGTARTDFPGGDAHGLYRSIRRILNLPEATRLYLCHDYKAPGREAYIWCATVSEQRAANIHIHDGVSEDAFVALREARDATLDMPRLILPSLQVNLRAGFLPEPDADGVRRLVLPLNAL